MAFAEPATWRRYCDYLCHTDELGITLDISRVRFEDDFIDAMDGPMNAAFDAMAALEAGTRANVDEQQMVGHYWLRDPGIAPTEEIGREIEAAVRQVSDLADGVLRGRIAGRDGTFTDAVHIGIGGSTTGSQLLSEVWPDASNRITFHFLDNADPDGVERVLAGLRGRLGRTLVSMVSKSGVTPTPWQVMLAVERAYERADVDFARHAVATTKPGSMLDRRATDGGWLARLPLWEWVGGRTSVTSAVGLLPAALRGADLRSLLAGARHMDRLTRMRAVRRNPAALLALMWYWAGAGRGDRSMVVLPYRDNLALLPRWVQQLVMESVGKRLDRTGRVVHQGLTVYGHKGTTDQHSYLQQLREGRSDFLVTFVGVHRDRAGDGRPVDPASTLGDHLFAGLMGTRAALAERGRDTITIMLPDTGEYSVGALVALYERAVGLYAELIDVNGYHQPGVDKYVAEPVLALQESVLDHLDGEVVPRTAGEIADMIGRPRAVDVIYEILNHLAVSGAHGVSRADAAPPPESRFTTRVAGHA